MDPVRTPQAEMEGERQRRARVTEENRSLHDLVIPEIHATRIWTAF
jgi:hypothetical protein